MSETHWTDVHDFFLNVSLTFFFQKMKKKKAWRPWFTAVLVFPDLPVFALPR